MAISLAKLAIRELTLARDAEPYAGSNSNQTAIRPLETFIAQRAFQYVEKSLCELGILVTVPMRDDSLSET